MILGTHNTMTYLTPKTWWMKLLSFTAKCQRVDFDTQFDLGVRAFDLRLFWDTDGNLEYRHGIIAYNAENIDDFLSLCNKEKCFVRVLFEERNNVLHRRTIKYNLKDKFIKLCKQLVIEYPNIKFYGGRNSSTGEILYDFNRYPKEVALYSSETSLFNSDNIILKKIDDLIPYIYARLKNKYISKLYRNSNTPKDIILVFDFIDICDF